VLEDCPHQLDAGFFIPCLNAVEVSMGIGTILLVLVLAVIGVVFGLAMRKPDTFRIERKAIINAAPEVVFRHLSEFRAWADWSPWETKDPAMRKDYGARTEGVGAYYGWEGNNKVGKGSMTITEATPPNRLLLRLDFEKPFKASNSVDFTLASIGPGTEIVWGMSGKANLMSKIMGLFMDMDRMVGPDFESGLANLKAVSEKQAG
jgi:uncharacterized protein YndB with AHSA1/START domain